MASYLAPTYVPKFTPYQDTRNVSLYTQVGLAKQQQFDQNVERIQGEVSKLSGLKVGRDIDQQYLDSKLSELRSNLTSLAGSDFAKTKVFRTAGAYAANLANDKRIQKDVISKMNSDDINNQIAEAKEKGTWNASNENLLRKQQLAWLNGGEDASLSKQTYTPYYNWTKDWVAFEKERHPNIKLTQIPNSTNPDGTPNYQAMTLKEGKWEVLDPTLVRNDFLAFKQANQQANTQISIDAQYYADKTDTASALAAFDAEHQQILDQIDKRIEDLRTQNSLNKDATQVAKRTEQIKDLLDQKSKKQLEYKNDKENFISNPEQYKMNSYVQTLASGMANRFAYSDVSDKIVENPIFNQQLKARQFDLQQQKFQYQQVKDKRDYDLKLRQLEEKKKAGEGDRIEAPLNVNNPKITASTISEGLDIRGDSVEQDKIKALVQAKVLKPGTFHIDPSSGRYYITDTTAYQNAWEQAKQAYEQGTLGNPILKQYFNTPGQGYHNYLEYKAEKTAYNARMQQVERELEKDPKYKAEKEEVRDNLIGNHSPTDIFTTATVVDPKTATQTKIPITRGDVYNFSIGNTADIDPKVVELLQNAKNTKVGNQPDNALSITDFVQTSILDGNKVTVFGLPRIKEIRDNFKEIKKKKDQAARDLVYGQWSTASAIPAKEGKDFYPKAKLIATALDRKGYGDDNQYSKDFNDYTAVREDGKENKVTYYFTQNPITKTVSLNVESSLKDEPLQIDLTPELAQQFAPEFFKPDIGRTILTEQHYNTDAYGNHISDPIPVQGNPNSPLVFRVSYQEYNGSQLPHIEYAPRGTNNWTEMGGIDSPAPDIESAIKSVQHLVSSDPNYLVTQGYISKDILEKAKQQTQ